MTTTEKRLILLLGGAVLVVGLMVSMRTYKKREAELIAERKEWLLLREEGEKWLAEKPLWEERGKLLQETRPLSENPEKETAALLEFLQASAAEAGVRLLEQRILPQESSGNYTAIGIELRTESSMEAFCKWLEEIQEAKRLRHAGLVRLTYRGEDEKLIGQVIAREFLVSQSP